LTDETDLQLPSLYGEFSLGDRPSYAAAIGLINIKIQWSHQTVDANRPESKDDGL
jgi:hypothetical protein